MNSNNEQTLEQPFGAAFLSELKNTGREHYHYQQPKPASPLAPTPSDPSERPCVTTKMNERSKQMKGEL